MATVADLNVRLGLLYDGLDRGLNQVERKLRRSGDRLSRLGSDLTLAISAPLAALGAASIREAANIESLQLALEAQMGSAKAARAEMELLRKEALKPGLGFEQAIQGSVQLQAVGFSAEMARKTLSAFGNALALAGKGKAELDGVATALTQISAKGKVSAEEINQIAERLPQIRTAMKAAFGTADTEVLQKAGISSEKFIAGVVEQLEKLPPATSGLKNSLENAGDAVKQFLGSLGAEINKTFNLSEKSAKLSEVLAAAAQGFSELDDSTKKTIITFGLAAVAAGPLIKVYGVLVSSMSSVAAVGSTAIGAIKSLTGFVLNLSTAFGRLQLALGVVGLVAGLAAAAYVFSQRFDAAAYSAEAFADAQKSVMTETSKEIGALERNFAVLKDYNSTSIERKAAVDALLKQYPDYLKGMNLEIQSVDQLTKIQAGLTEEIQRSVAVRKRAEAVNSIYEKRADILFRINELQKGAETTVSEAALIDTGDMLRAGSIAGAVIEKLKQQADELKNSATSLGKQYDEAFGMVGMSARRATPASQVLGDLKNRTDGLSESTKKGIDLSNKDADAKKKQKDAFDGYLESMNKAESARKKSLEVRTAMGVGPLESLPQAPGAILPDSAAPSIGAITEGLTAMTELTTAAGNGFTKLTNTISTGGTVMEQVGYAMASAFQAAGESGETSFGKMALAAVGAAAKIIRTNIQIAVTQAALSALRSIPFPFNIAAAAAAGALASGLFNKLITSVGVPALAEGGVISKPTTALMGEYPGARTNPEIVTPENKMRDVFKGVMRRFGGMGGGVLTTRIAGKDLVFVLEQAQFDNRRTRGR